MAGSTSPFSVFMILLKSYLGTGLLAIPYAFECGGLWASVVGVCILAAMSNYTMQTIVRLKNHIENHSDEWPVARNSMQDPLLEKEGDDVEAELDDDDEDAAAISYQDIGRFAFGAKGKLVATLAMYVTNIGIATAYIMFVANTLSDAVHGNHDPGSAMVFKLVGAINLNCYTIVILPLVIGLCQLRSLGFMGVASLIGNVALLSAVVLVLAFAGGKIHQPKFDALDIPTFPVFFGITVFSFAMHGVILSIEESMADQAEGSCYERQQAKQKALFRIMDFTVAFVVLVYAAFGCVGLAAYEALIDQSVLSNLPFIPVVETLEYLMCLAILLSIPIFTFPVFEGLEAALFDKSKQVAVDEEGEEGEGGEGQAGFCSGKELKVSMFRSAVIVTLTVTAVLLGPLFAYVVSLVGSLSMSLLAFVLPCMFKIKMLGKKFTTCDAIITWGMLIFGMVAMGVATTVNVIQITDYFIDPNKGSSCSVPTPTPTPAPTLVPTDQTNVTLV